MAEYVETLVTTKKKKLILTDTETKALCDAMMPLIHRLGESTSYRVDRASMIGMRDRFRDGKMITLKQLLFLTILFREVLGTTLYVPGIEFWLTSAATQAENKMKRAAKKIAEAKLQEEAEARAGEARTHTS